MDGSIVNWYSPEYDCCSNTNFRERHKEWWYHQETACYQKNAWQNQINLKIENRIKYISVFPTMFEYYQLTLIGLFASGSRFRNQSNPATDIRVNKASTKLT